ncbi:mediator of RNA polymerase II transcription subunit 27-like [Pollicipes pollicipes]|uniref:mediator of RNA polymerase II transcription subunit 27-like n=1 Tax=Pollicipes pollicipes TaxID=41117 RepID=UPI0018859615|nr:mediator of RNA polymerase II transcription subunit 27-like [Pollicipes pollicipes]
MAEKTIESLSKALGCVQQLRTSVCDVFRYLAEGNAEPCDDDAQRKHCCTGHLLDSYKWTEKVRDYASFASPVWSQNGVKRSQNLVVKKRRLQMQTSHCQPQQHVDAILNTIGRSFMDMGLLISRPCGANSAVVQVTLDRVLQAVITFKGLLIEWVMIRGYDEPMSTEDGRVDLWTPSDYHVFRKVSENAQAAMVHYYGPLHPEFSARSYLTWIHSYVNLFSAPCVKCGSRLQNAMPPTWRDFKSLQPYHEDCKS